MATYREDVDTAIEISRLMERVDNLAFPEKPTRVILRSLIFDARSKEILASAYNPVRDVYGISAKSIHKRIDEFIEFDLITLIAKSDESFGFKRTQDAAAAGWVAHELRHRAQEIWGVSLIIDEPIDRSDPNLLKTCTRAMQYWLKYYKVLDRYDKKARPYEFDARVIEFLVANLWMVGFRNLDTIAAIVRADPWEIPPIIA